LSHPTQGLLDVLTIRMHKRRFAGLKVAIVGDIRHSRVARSAARALQTLGTTDLRLVAPEMLLPGADEFAGAQRYTRIEDGIMGADVIMMLRIQKERMVQAAALDDAAYFREFGLDPRRLKLASPSVLVMHPGPMNRGVEIASEVADGPRSVIREQVNNGVAVRMAVLAAIAATLTLPRSAMQAAYRMDREREDRGEFQADAQCRKQPLHAGSVLCRQLPVAEVRISQGSSTKLIATWAAIAGAMTRPAAT